VGCPGGELNPNAVKDYCKCAQDTREAKKLLDAISGYYAKHESLKSIPEGESSGTFL
jgi:hypothetical protein